MAKSGRFLSMKFEILQLEDLAPMDKMVLGRIGSFKEYFESADKLAEILGYSVGSIRKSRQKLERLGYIKAIRNNGRGKTYVAREDFRLRKYSDAEPFPAPSDDKDDTPQVTIRPVETPVSERHTSIKKLNQWERKNPRLVPLLDASMNYLSRNGIPVTNPRKLRNELSIVARTLATPDDPGRETRVITQYLDYLESDAYLYQQAHSKYCPQILTQYDLYGKFSAVRAFKHDMSRHYDPSKTLTPD